jgi:hypothetical protein
VAGRNRSIGNSSDLIISGILRNVIKGLGLGLSCVARTGQSKQLILKYEHLESLQEMCILDINGRILIETNLKKMESEEIHWIYLAQDRINDGLLNTAMILFCDA